MKIELSNAEAIYLYNALKKELDNLETVKPKSLVKSDIRLHKSILTALETAMPQLKMLPL